MNRAQRRSAKRSVLEYEPVNPFARMMRPSCSECSGPVQWMSIGEALDVLGVDGLNRLFPDGFEDPDEVELDFWRCRSCGNSGVLGPAIAG